MIKILVVDKEQGVCKSIQRIFTYIGFSVFTATTVKKAADIFSQHAPRIVFWDIALADADGTATLKSFKAQQASCIVILIVGAQEVSSEKKILELCADEVIFKPFSRNDLQDVVVAKIKNLLDKGGHMRKPFILIVDDEQDARESIKRFIDPRYVCDIALAADGQEALEKVKEFKPDVVLLDIKMPGLSGIEVIHTIKALHSEASVVIISAWKSADVVSRAVQAGASDYIEKPVVLSVLGEKLKMLLLSKGKLILKEH